MPFSNYSQVNLNGTVFVNNVYDFKYYTMCKTEKCQKLNKYVSARHRHSAFYERRLDLGIQAKELHRKNLYQLILFRNLKQFWSWHYLILRLHIQFYRTRFSVKVVHSLLQLFKRLILPGRLYMDDIQSGDELHMTMLNGELVTLRKDGDGLRGIHQPIFTSLRYLCTLYLDRILG